jgi:protease-4
MNEKRKPNYWLVAIIVLLVLGLVSVAFAGFIGLLVLGEEPIAPGNVAVIDVDGIITSAKTGIFSAPVASSTDIAKLIEKADKDDGVKAMVLMINSPGGSAVASDEIAQAVKAANKTTVAVIREAGASGAYWVASAADHVIANKASLTGSIGVRASYLEFPGLLQEYNITYRRLVAGKHKDMGSPFRELTPEEQELFQEVLDEMHDLFINEVASNRNMDYDAVAEIATGQFFTGLKAKKLGLVDELGGKKEAKAYIERTLNITAELKPYKKPKTLFESITGGVSEHMYSIGRGIGDSLLAADAENTLRVHV